MKKFILVITFLLIGCIFVQADEIGKYIQESDIETKSIVSIYSKNTEDGSIIYNKNSKKLLNPASIVKTLTFGASYVTLGADYEFKTVLYKDSSNDIYIKLGGDPLLSSDDLCKLFKTLKSKFDTSKIRYIYIDDSIIDKSPYPDGWMTDDIWPYQRMLTPYIVDGNKTDISIKRSSLSTRVDIIQNDSYKVPIINELKLQNKKDAKQEIKIVRQYGELPIINFKGTVVKDEIIALPVLDSELNFKIKLQSAIEKSGIIYHKKIFNKKLPANIKEYAQVSHSIKDISKEILYNSNNFIAEIVFRVAAAKYINYSRPATTNDGINMFNSVFNTNEDIKITDASGVSRYDLLNTEFIVNALIELSKKTDIKELLPTSNEGTLKDRLVFLKDNLRAKTGTLAKMSSICGFLTTSNNKNIVFAIIVQNSPKRKALLKNFEDNIITIFYKEY